MIDLKYLAELDQEIDLSYQHKKDYDNLPWWKKIFVKSPWTEENLNHDMSKM